MLSYKSFIKNTLENNDTHSLNKYDRLTQRLVEKDIKFNKYLLKNNNNLLKQYGASRFFTKKSIIKLNNINLTNLENNDMYSLNKYDKLTQR